MPRRPEIGAVQLYPNRPLRRTDKNGYILKFYCPIRGKRVRRNCGAQPARSPTDSTRVPRRLINGEYAASNGAITATQTIGSPVAPHPAASEVAGNSWQGCYDSYRKRLRGRSIEDTISRLSIAERIFTAWHQTRGLAGGVRVQECFTDDGIEHLQNQLLAGAEGRYKSPGTLYRQFDRQDSHDLCPLLLSQEVDRTSTACGFD